MRCNELYVGGGVIRTELPAFVMGIVNITPDSFWSGSRCALHAVHEAVDKALMQIADGAQIIDIGGESSRPGAEYVSAEEEIARIIPVIQELRSKSDCVISVDTRKQQVMQAAYEAGANMCNDISALEDDEAAAEYIADTGIPVILMHKRGNPVIMQQHTSYTDVFAEVNSYLHQRIEYALSKGIQKKQIIIDPGIGFGKDLAANRILIQECGKLCGGQYPVLMGLSRKTCIGEMTGRDVAGRLAGTLAANLIAVQCGASIVRVHDVRETVDMLKILRNL